MPSNEQQLQHAQSLHQQGRLDEALQHYQAILEQQPNDIAVIQLVCLVYVQKGDLVQGENLIRDALARLPKEASLYNSLGNIQSRQEKLTDAITSYETAIGITAAYPGALNNLGNCYLRLQQPSQAESCYQQAIAIDADYPDAHFNLARLYIEQSATEAAIQHLEQVIKIAPQHAGALGQLGNIYLLEGNLERAVLYLNKRTAMQPHAEAYQALATAYLQLKDYDQAIQSLEKALQLNAKLPDTLYMLATAHLQKGQPDQAIRYYLRQVEQQPHLDSFYNLGVLMADKQRHQEAIDYFKQALALEPTHLASHLNMAAVYLKLNNTEQAILHYQTASHLDPNDLEIQHILHALTKDLVPEQAPITFISNLFNQYAPNYDQHLQTQLDYQVPSELHRLLIEHIQPEEHSLRILDLGCGTGLAGELFKKYSSELIGVDISEAMLAIAKAKGIYQAVIHDSIESALAQFSEIDLVLAADVFPYCGDLKNVFQKVAACLRPGGWFAFSIEKTSEDPYTLQKTIRYAHNKNYVESLCSENKLSIESFLNISLRKQQKKSLEGYLFLAKKQ